MCGPELTGWPLRCRYALLLAFFLSGNTWRCIPAYSGLPFASGVCVPGPLTQGHRPVLPWPIAALLLLFRCGRYSETDPIWGNLVFNRGPVASFLHRVLEASGLHGLALWRVAGRWAGLEESLVVFRSGLPRGGGGRGAGAVAGRCVTCRTFSTPGVRGSAGPLRRLYLCTPTPMAFPAW